MSFAPVGAVESVGMKPYRGFSALSALTVYAVLLCAIPSNLAVGALGSLGRPALLWGLVLAVWWVIHHLHTPPPAVRAPWQPVRFFFMVIVVIALVSFAAALLRGQPADQISPATTALLRLVSWGGVLFVAMDGIRTMSDLRVLLARVVFLATLVAILGLVQTFTGASVVDQISIPGLIATEDGGVQARGSFTRAAGTATHPLEFAMLLTMALPLALTGATVASERAGKQSIIHWGAVAIIAGAVLISASRSALLGFAVAFIVTLPGLHRRLRTYLVVGTVALLGVIIVIQPGMFGTMLSMFSGVSSDPSALSRTGGLERAPGFIEVSPLVGSGLGTFLPRYYIFDNQWILIAVELGLLGLVAFAALFGSAMWSAWRARHLSPEQDVRTLGQGLVGAIATGVVLLAGFDGLAFPISAGVIFLIVGLSASLRSIANADCWMRDVRPEQV